MLKNSKSSVIKSLHVHTSSPLIRRSVSMPYTETDLRWRRLLRVNPSVYGLGIIIVVQEVSRCVKDFWVRVFVSWWGCPVSLFLLITCSHYCTYLRTVKDITVSEEFIECFPDGLRQTVNCKNFILSLYEILLLFNMSFMYLVIVSK